MRWFCGKFYRGIVLYFLEICDSLFVNLMVYVMIGFKLIMYMGI